MVFSRSSKNKSGSKPDPSISALFNTDLPTINQSDLEAELNDLLGDDELDVEEDESQVGASVLLAHSWSKMKTVNMDC